MKTMLQFTAVAVIFLSGTMSWASGDAAAGHGEAKKEEVKVAAPPEWMGLQSEIQKLAAEIKAKQDNLTKLFGSGHDAHGGGGGGAHGAADAHASGSGVQEINKEHKALRDLIADYEKKRTILRYRYPEAGAQSDRKYKRIELKSLDQLRSETLVERRLRETSEKIKKVYGHQDEATEKKSTQVKGHQIKDSRQPASETRKNSEEEKIPLLDEQIILKK